MRAGAAPFLSPLTRALLAALVVAAMPAASLRAQAAPSASTFRTEEVRAVFLVNLIRFTEWPASALPENASFLIGVAGSRAMEDELLRLADRITVRNRRIRVVRVKNVRDLDECHLLYIAHVSEPGEEPGPSVEELLPHARQRPILSVSGAPSFLEQGGIVRFFTGEQGKLRFDVAADRARENGLVLSSSVLALARTTRPPKSEGDR